jgi:excisionase family DNA binding protein
MPNLTEHMSLEAVETEYGRPRSTLRHWIRKGLLPSYRLGRRRFVRRSDLERLIAEALERDRVKHSSPGAR